MEPSRKSHASEMRLYMPDDKTESVRYIHTDRRYNHQAFACPSSKFTTMKSGKKAQVRLETTSDSWYSSVLPGLEPTLHAQKAKVLLLDHRCFINMVQDWWCSPERVHQARLRDVVCTVQTSIPSTIFHAADPGLVRAIDFNITGHPPGRIFGSNLMQCDPIWSSYIYPCWRGSMHFSATLYLYRWWLLRFHDSAHVKDDDCRSGSLPEILQYRVWPVSRTETFNTQVHWLKLPKEI